MHDDLLLAYKAHENQASIQLGSIITEKTLLQNAPVHLKLKSFNRHGLIAGATGTGKTKTIQVLCEQLSESGVPVMVMDIKGDLSGLAVAGEKTSFIENRCKDMQIPFEPRGYPTELCTLNPKQPGVVLRITVESFGPLLFSRMLDVNETQAGAITIVFEYAKNNGVPLVDLADFKALLTYLQTEQGKNEMAAQYGAIAQSSMGAILREIIELESQGGSEFFGKPEFQTSDLVRTDASGQGIISVLRLMDMQDRPALFSTFMLKLLSDVYREFPEIGDPEKPRLVIFIDEAHLIFNHAGKALLNLLDTMVKLIRSKGVGLFFCTQTPNDIPESILGQLGLKIQHALRAFTAKDRKAIRLMAQNFPPSEHYQTETLLTALGIGEALVCALDEKGQPTPLIQCKIRPPQSRMGTLTDQEIQRSLNASTLSARYATRDNTLSAKAFLEKHKSAHPIEAKIPKNRTDRKAQNPEPSVINQLSKNTLFRQLTRDFFRYLLRMLTKIIKGNAR